MKREQKGKMKQEDPARLDELLTIEDITAILKVSPKTIYNWTYRDLIPCLKLGRGLLRFRQSEILNWLNQKGSA